MNTYLRCFFYPSFQIKPEVGLPTKICDPCLKNLSIAHKFKTSCLVADETFRKLAPPFVSPLIKAEEPELSEYEYEEIIECKDENDDELEHLKVEFNETVVGENGTRKSGRVKVKDGYVLLRV